MKKQLSFLIIFVLILIAVGISAASENDIKSSYTDFQAALKSEDGKKAVELVCRSTFDFYEEARKLALNSDGIDFEKESQMKVLLTLQLRYLLSKKELTMLADGKNVFEWAITSGLVKKDIINSYTINKVQVEGQQAFATIFKNGTPVKDAVFNFKNENSVWKFDMLRLITAPEAGLDEVRRQADKTKVELAVYVMEKSYGKKIPFDILNGPLK